MTDITFTENGRAKAGVAKPKKFNARIDMTPMVDLGFLLITFFIFTSTIGQPGAMKLIMPKESTTTTRVRQSGALTILPSENGALYYYEGFFQPEGVKRTGLNEIRSVISNKKGSTSADEFFVIIKPTEKAGYGHIVDLLDEMTISGVQKYALANITLQEESLIE